MEVSCSIKHVHVALMVLYPSTQSQRVQEHRKSKLTTAINKLSHNVKRPPWVLLVQFVSSWSGCFGCYRIFKKYCLLEEVGPWGGTCGFCRQGRLCFAFLSSEKQRCPATGWRCHAFPQQEIEPSQTWVTYCYMFGRCNEISTIQVNENSLLLGPEFSYERD